jgi:hypothetical protein
MIAAAVLAFALTAPAGPGSEGAERFVVELRVIEGVPGPAGSAQNVDPRLAAFAKDLKALPFKQLKLLDAHTTSVRSGERIQLEIPQSPGAKGPRRFLQVAAHGKQAGGKLRFELSIEALKFDTLVAVPDGGTIFVAVPHAGGSNERLVFAFTAHSQPG